MLHVLPVEFIIIITYCYGFFFFLHKFIIIEIQKQINFANEYGQFNKLIFTIKFRLNNYLRSDNSET